ncbi:NAD dependent epimerase/dehydratase family protein [Asticcacaulis biprosthecium C19]|uniref:NAD dependent epimerase/dehydratase family protein n=1 Tax=Asticcacaulis biprosthecium C19 TaxID=715226 RepID=F4QRR1_9CAUL|nr:NAD-dependent epimerase/dehydratase family protein [Asticcacaulis biprosthecium]EGF89431.1 NAD dependent epimerase/dehydratase family protein [Asticcacaulis biprosthecium C19]
MSRILVTGASGLIGRHTLAHLVGAGFEVHAVGRSTAEPLDLLNTAAVRAAMARIRPTHLLHNAWYTEHGRFWHAPENAVWLDASKALFAAFAEAGGRRVIGVGTCAEYDWVRSDTTPWRENDPLAPATPYGRAKNDLHQWLAGQGIDYAWARLFLLFGPGENPARIVPHLIRCALTGEPARCSSGRQVRDFLSTQACGERVAAVATSNLSGAVNIASGVGLSLRDLAPLIEAATGRPLRAEFGALPDRPEDPPYMVADVARLNALGIPTFDLKAALNIYVSGFR